MIYAHVLLYSPEKSVMSLICSYCCVICQQKGLVDTEDIEGVKGSEGAIMVMCLHDMHDVLGVEAQAHGPWKYDLFTHIGPQTFLYSQG